MIVSEGVKFFPADFSMSLNGQEVTFRGLLSELGITRITAIEGSPNSWKEAYGREHPINIGSLKLRGLLVQHYDSAGATSLIRFSNLSENERAQIKVLVESKGVFPGWQRKLPRIPVEDNAGDLPLPSLCTVRFAGQEVYVEVMNFTLGGLGIKAIGSQLAPARVGMRLQFDLITNRGDIISNSTAEIMNVSVLDWQGEKNAQTGSALRYLGMKILEMSAEGKAIYKALIRDYCLAQKKSSKL